MLNVLLLVSYIWSRLNRHS